MRTQLQIGTLQMGHTRRLGAHSGQTKWPQGTKTTETARSRHTLHVLSSCSCRSCSCTDPAPGDSRSHQHPQGPRDGLLRGNALVTQTHPLIPHVSPAVPPRKKVTHPPQVDPYYTCFTDVFRLCLSSGCEQFRASMGRSCTQLVEMDLIKA